MHTTLLSHASCRVKLAPPCSDRCFSIIDLANLVRELTHGAVGLQVFLQVLFVEGLDRRGSTAAQTLHDALLADSICIVPGVLLIGRGVVAVELKSLQATVGQSGAESHHAHTLARSEEGTRGSRHGVDKCKRWDGCSNRKM